MPNFNDLMRTPEAAKYLRLSASMLAKLRMRGGGPQYIKLGPRIVGYLKSDLDEWIASRSRRSTSQEIRSHATTHKTAHVEEI